MSKTTGKFRIGDHWPTKTPMAAAPSSTGCCTYDPATRDSRLLKTKIILRLDSTSILSSPPLLKEK